MQWFGKKTKTHYEKLSEKWVKRHVAIQENLWKKHGKVLQEIRDKTKQYAISSLAGMLLLLSPATQIKGADIKTVKEAPVVPDLPKQSQFLIDLATVVPQQVRELSPQEEGQIAQVLSQYTGMKVSAELGGIRLNRTYGFIGKEQHLARYPGDTMATHFDNPDDAATFAEAGMAPGLGGWGYFTTNGQFTQEDALREKYYIAVQTFLAPGYADNVRKYSEFFRWRKMLVVNPQNGKALVADIGDAGPAVWTGKQLGGSPEVMNYLQRVDGAQRGPVLYFFIDDPQNNIPLGPVQL
ncbi:MAG TPA: hypothetical protein VFQ63_02865 [Patescibacteria group bacterium]|nr:hypothetical protein [Patescibacteria group bacterium]